MNVDMHRARRVLRWSVIMAVLAAVGFASPASAAATVNLWGPDSITSTGNYTYTASYLAPYASFQWATRSCATATVDSCTTAWTVAFGSYRDQFSETLTRYLTYTCPLSLKPTVNTYQVRVIGSPDCNRKLAPTTML